MWLFEDDTSEFKSYEHKRGRRSRFTRFNAAALHLQSKIMPVA